MVGAACATRHAVVDGEVPEGEDDPAARATPLLTSEELVLVRPVVGQRAGVRAVRHIRPVVDLREDIELVPEPRLDQCRG